MEIMLEFSILSLVMFQRQLMLLQKGREGIAPSRPFLSGLKRLP
jgi:hypothetical protein